MTIIDSETVVVFNYGELKTVIEGNNTYNLIYFGADITSTGGIHIPAYKSNITIDGTYNSVRYRYTDYPSSAYTSAIYLTGTSNLYITVRNMDITGNNYYGVICIYDASSLNGVVVDYNNINYVGPQLAFNPYSSLIITDSNITIQAATSTANEVAETRNVTLGGNVVINSSTTGNSIFWFRNVVGGVYPFLYVRPNANVSITSQTRYFYYVSSAAYINMTFGEGSITNIDTATGMGYDDGHHTNSVTIDNNAVLNIEQRQSFGVTATWCIVGQFRMNSGSELKMVSNYSGNTSNRCLEFIGTGASINFNNPRSVVLYNLSANAIYSRNTINYSLNIPQYNRWLTVTPYASAGDIYDIPSYSWYKLENTNNLTVNGTITTSTTTISSINLTSGEQASLPPLSNFLLNNTRVLSMGRPTLSIDPITDLSTEMTGVTVPNADVRIGYEGNDYYVQADGSGNFIYSYSPPLAIGTEISFVSNLAYSFLYRFRTVEIIYPGDLFIESATSHVTFENTPFQMTPTLCQRSSPLKVVVNDNRITPTVWRLYASITHELTNEKGNILVDGLVFVDSMNNMKVLSNTPSLVYTSDGVTTGLIEVEWTDDEGILLQLNVVPIVLNTTYQADINWSLE